MTTPPGQGPPSGFGEVPVPGETPGYAAPPPFAPPSAGQVPYGQGYTQPGQPHYGQPGYGQPGYGQYGQPPYPPPGYGAYPYPPPGYWAPQVGTNGMAIASMVLGILWIYWIGSVLALIFGYAARSQLKRNPQNGGGFAIAGIVLGWVGIATLILVIVLAVAVSHNNTTYSLFSLLTP